MARVALIDSNGVVDNVIEITEGSQYDPPQGLTIHALEESERIGPGWTLGNNAWVEPESTEVEPEPSLEDRLAEIETELRGMKDRAEAVTDSDAAEVRDAITGPATNRR